MSETDLREGIRCCGSSGCVIAFISRGLSNGDPAGEVASSSERDAIMSLGMGLKQEKENGGEAEGGNITINPHRTCDRSFFLSIDVAKDLFNDEATGLVGAPRHVVA